MLLPPQVLIIIHLCEIILSYINSSFIIKLVYLIIFLILLLHLHLTLMFLSVFYPINILTHHNLVFI